MTDIRQMQIGQIVDFCVAYNERHKEETEPERSKPKKRRATQKEIDAYFG